jgi:hypothetical protein
MGKTAQHTAIPFVERLLKEGSLVRSTYTPTFHYYVVRGPDVSEPDVDDAIVDAFATSFRSSLAIRGVMKDRQFWHYGPYSTEQAELEIGLPSGKTRFYVLTTGFSPAPGSLLPMGGGGTPLLRGQIVADELTSAVPEPRDRIAQCADGLDNEADGYADACDFACVEHVDFGTDLFAHDVRWEMSKDIGMFGAVEFCTRHMEAYASMYMMWGESATSILNWVEPAEPPMGYDPTIRPPPFRISMRGCVIVDGVDGVADAVACDRDDMCPAALSTYPLAGLSGSWGTATTGLLGKVWGYVDYTIVNGDVDDTHPLHIALVFPFEYDNEQAEAGLAVVYDPQHPNRNGAGLVRWDTDLAGNQGGTGSACAHEVGHCLGLAHDLTGIAGTSFNGFMWGETDECPTCAGGGAAPVLDWNADAEPTLPQGTTQGNVWQSFAPLKDVPRASGFMHRGCNDDDEVCQTGHPGLGCSAKDVCEPE